MDRWLRDNPRGVIIVHCSTGMGTRAVPLVRVCLSAQRSSTVWKVAGVWRCRVSGRSCQRVAAYLRVSRLTASAQEAIQLVANRRTARLPRTLPSSERVAAARAVGPDSC